MSENNKITFSNDSNHLVTVKQEISQNVIDQAEASKDSVLEIINFSVEELQNIERINTVANDINELINFGKDFSNHGKYFEFLKLFSGLNDKEKKYFEETYCELRVVYYYTKISNNIKNGGSLKLANITGYLNQIKDEKFDMKYIEKFWGLFSFSEKKFLLEHYENYK